MTQIHAREEEQEITGAVEMTTKVGIDLEQTAHYIESCQTEDGGFFFARIPPSPAGDTYHSVKSLQILRRQPANRDAVIGLASRVPSLWEEATPEERRRLLIPLVERVYVDISTKRVGAIVPASGFRLLLENAAKTASCFASPHPC
jgi:hypothetical protein